MKNKNDLTGGFSEKNLRKLVGDLNATIITSIQTIETYGLLEFGAGMFYDNGVRVFRDPNLIIDSTIAARILDKFEQPDKSNERKLRDEATAGWIRLEEEHVRHYSPNALFHKFGTKDKSTFLRGKYALARILNNFDKYLAEAPLDFGPGESYISNRGNTSLYDKLDVNLWSVTYDALDDFAKLVVSNRALKISFFDFVQKTYGNKPLKGDETERKRIKKENRRRRAFFTDLVATQGAHKPTNIVKAVLTHMNLVIHGGRGTSVYKNRKKRRFITIEPFGNVVLQKCVGYAFRCCLKENGIDLDTGQDRHYELIQHRVDTTDWSNASDVINNLLTIELLPYKISRILQRYRSPFIELTYDIEGERVITSHVAHKISSMGNGFTFELLTLINVAFSKEFDPNAVSYGDDVIITNGAAEEFVKFMELIGFQPNTKKSFIGLPMKESCGGFHLEGYGYITCYDFKWANDLLDVIILLNKIRRIYKAHPSSRVARLLYNQTLTIRNQLPKAFKGPESKISSFRGSTLPNWLECDAKQLSNRTDNPVIRRIYKFGIVGSEPKTRLLPITGYRAWSAKIEGPEYFAKKLTEREAVTSNPGLLSDSIKGYVERLQCEPTEFSVVLKTVVSSSIRVKKKSIVKDNRLLYTYIKNGHADVTVRVKEDRRLNFVWTLIDFEGYEHGSIVIDDRVEV